MLILSRRGGEKIIVGDRDLTITVVEVRNGMVRLGIDAPLQVPVYREEIYLARRGSSQEGARVMATAWQSVSLDSGGAVLVSGARAFGLVFESVAEADEFQLFAREMHGPNWAWMLPAALDQCLTLMRSLPRIACESCGVIHRAYGQHGRCPKCDV